MTRSYPAKILLFGEYTVLFGSSALALPFGNYSGRWTPSSLPDERLISYMKWLKEQPAGQLLYLDRIEAEWHSGLRFDSCIPSGYGLGSSGALVAGIWDRYAKTPIKDLPELRRNLGALETYFHGQSSGLDPVISYLNTPVTLLPDDGLRAAKSLTETSVLKHFFLFNSGQARKTAPLVQIFRKNIKNPAYKDIIKNQLLPANESAITALKHGSYSGTSSSVERISTLQLAYFKAMIPPHIADFWKAGIEDKSYYTKLCGAGGGGFFLVFVPDTRIINRLPGKPHLISLQV